MLLGTPSPPTKTESYDAPRGMGPVNEPPFPALWWCEHMCPGWPRHSVWVVSGRGEPASPRLRTCLPRAGVRALSWASRGSLGPGSSSPQTYLLGPPCQRRAAAAGWEGGRYRGPRHF